MECKETLGLLNAYVDEFLCWKEMAIVEQHLQVCSDCDYEYHQLKSLKQLMGSVQRREPPQNLVLRMKIEASKRNRNLMLQRAFSKVKDFLRVTAFPAFSGVALTFLCFVILLSTFFTGTNLNASDKDIPLTLITEPRARSLYMSQFVQLEDFVSVREPIIVETYVGIDGRIRSYKILNGPQDRAAIRSLDQFFEVSFDPATSFGRPISGKIVLSLVFFPTTNNKIDVVG